MQGRKYKKTLIYFAADILFVFLLKSSKKHKKIQ